MIVRRAAVPLVIMLLYGCSLAPISTAPVEPGDLMAMGTRLFRDGCPRTASFSERKVSNPHQPAVIDTIRTTSCDGMELTTYIGVLASDPAGLPISIEIRQPQKGLPRYMNVGEPVRGLFEVLGHPSEQNDSSVTYRTSDVDDSVTFSLREGWIKSVRWDWFFD